MDKERQDRIADRLGSAWKMDLLRLTGYSVTYLALREDEGVGWVEVLAVDRPMEVMEGLEVSLECITWGLSLTQSTGLPFVIAWHDADDVIHYITYRQGETCRYRPERRDGKCFVEVYPGDLATVKEKSDGNADAPQEG